MISVPNVRTAVDWYKSIGFQLEGEQEIDTNAAWAGLSFGGWFLMLVPGGTSNTRQAVSFWLRTDGVDDLYQVLKQRQMERSAAILRNEKSDIPEARFVQDLHNAFYGEREFAIVDLNGYELHFVQAIES